MANEQRSSTKMKTSEEAIEEGPEQCPHCGKEVAGEFDFCPYCGRGLRVMKIPQIEYHPNTEKRCARCSADIDASFAYCPYCGHHQGEGLKKEEPSGSWRMLVLYALTFLVPPAGVLIWLMWKKDPEGETRNEAEYCLGSAFLGLVVYVLIVSIYF
ncbi:MAG TPA: zinc ribbon domain-containing protein [Methanomassiliicoccales archaeon]|jgi:hypothetical protein